MNANELIEYAKRRPYVAGAVAVASAGVVGFAAWRGRGDGAAAEPAASLGVVGDKTAISDGYPGVIVNQVAPVTPAPAIPAPGGSQLGYVLRDGKRIAVDLVMGSGATSCPAGYVSVRRKDGQIVCTKSTDVGADKKRYLWFDPLKGNKPDLKSQYR